MLDSESEIEGELDIDDTYASELDAEDPESVALPVEVDFSDDESLYVLSLLESSSSLCASCCRCPDRAGVFGLVGTVLLLFVWC